MGSLCGYHASGIAMPGGGLHSRHLYKQTWNGEESLTMTLSGLFRLALLVVFLVLGFAALVLAAPVVLAAFPPAGATAAGLAITSFTPEDVVCTRGEGFFSIVKVAGLPITGRAGLDVGVSALGLSIVDLLGGLKTGLWAAVGLAGTSGGVTVAFPFWLDKNGLVGRGAATGLGWVGRGADTGLGDLGRKKSVSTTGGLLLSCGWRNGFVETLVLDVLTGIVTRGAASLGLAPVGLLGDGDRVAGEWGEREAGEDGWALTSTERAIPESGVTVDVLGVGVVLRSSGVVSVDSVTDDVEVFLEVLGVSLAVCLVVGLAGCWGRALEVTPDAEASWVTQTKNKQVKHTTPITRLPIVMRRLL